MTVGQWVLVNTYMLQVVRPTGTHPRDSGEERQTRRALGSTAIAVESIGGMSRSMGGMSTARFRGIPSPCGFSGGGCAQASSARASSTKRFAIAIEPMLASSLSGYEVQ